MIIILEYFVPLSVPDDNILSSNVAKHKIYKLRRDA
jgi:hypothetical protein